MKLERLIAALGPTEVVGRAPLEIRELAYDSREVSPGALFFCIPGAKADGHAFAEDALVAGASALVVERPLGIEAAQHVVPSVREAMRHDAAEFFRAPSRVLVVLGVAGTIVKPTNDSTLRSVVDVALRHL